MKQFFSSRLFLGVVILSVAAAVAYGFFLSGSPATQRALQFDQRRVSDLQQISFAIDSYWERNAQFPEALEQLQDSRHYALGSIADPESGEPYEYRQTGEKTYELCAVFNLESGAERIPSRFPSRVWEHGVGRTCFQLEVELRQAL